MFGNHFGRRKSFHRHPSEANLPSCIIHDNHYVNWYDNRYNNYSRDFWGFDHGPLTAFTCSFSSNNSNIYNVCFALEEQVSSYNASNSTGFESVAAFYEYDGIKEEPKKRKKEKKVDEDAWKLNPIVQAIMKRDEEQAAANPKAIEVVSDGDSWSTVEEETVCSSGVGDDDKFDEFVGEIKELNSFGDKSNDIDNYPTDGYRSGGGVSLGIGLNDDIECQLLDSDSSSDENVDTETKKTERKDTASRFINGINLDTYDVDSGKIFSSVSCDIYQRDLDANASESNSGDSDIIEMGCFGKNDNIDYEQSTTAKKRRICFSNGEAKYESDDEINVVNCRCNGKNYKQLNVSNKVKPGDQEIGDSPGNNSNEQELSNKSYVDEMNYNGIGDIDNTDEEDSFDEENESESEEPEEESDDWENMDMDTYCKRIMGDLIYPVTVFIDNTPLPLPRFSKCQRFFTVLKAKTIDGLKCIKMLEKDRLEDGKDASVETFVLPCKGEGFVTQNDVCMLAIGDLYAVTARRNVHTNDTLVFWKVALKRWTKDEMYLKYYWTLEPNDYFSSSDFGASNRLQVIDYEFSSNGQCITLLMQNGFIFTVDIQRKHQVWQVYLPPGGDRMVKQLTLHPTLNATLVFAMKNECYSLDCSSKSQSWDMIQSVIELPRDYIINYITFSQSRDLLSLCTGPEGDVFIYSVDKHQYNQLFKLEHDTVASAIHCDFSWTSEELLVSYGDADYRIWQLPKHLKLKKIARIQFLKLVRGCHINQLKLPNSLKEYLLF
eukprot:TCONS_00047328-protein